jgi:hypothetical protein
MLQVLHQEKLTRPPPYILLCPDTRRLIGYTTHKAAPSHTSIQISCMILPFYHVKKPLPLVFGVDNGRRPA